MVIPVEALTSSFRRKPESSDLLDPGFRRGDGRGDDKDSHTGGSRIGVRDRRRYPGRNE